MTSHYQVLINAGDLSQASLTSSIANLSMVYGYCIQSSVTGTGVGVLKIQASCDKGIQEDGTGVATWTDVTSSAVNGTGTIMFNIDAAHYSWIRCIYTKTSGTGTITSILNAKSP